MVDLFKEEMAKVFVGGEFQVEFDRRGYFLNDERDTKFLSFLVSEASKEKLVELIGHVDEVMKKMGERVYYEPPVPHLTFAWMPSDTLQEGRETLQDVHHLEESFSIIVSRVKVVIGKYEYFFELKN